MKTTTKATKTTKATRATKAPKATTTKINVNKFVQYANENIVNTELVKTVTKVQDLNTNRDVIKVSASQMAYFEESSKILFDTYRKKEMLDTDSPLLNNDRKLENYTITIENGQYIKIKDIYNNYQYGYFSLGNSKLKKDSTTTYLIWNITPRIACYSATEICKNTCYACKGKANCDNVVKPRSNNFILSTFSNFSDIFKEVIELVGQVFKTRILIRVHESGDFYSTEYTNKIHNALVNVPYKTLIYTKDIKALESFDNIDNVTTRFSIMDDTAQDIQNYVMDNNLNTFLCVDKNTFETIPPSMKCPSLCTTCLKCWNKDKKVIFVKKH